MAGTYLDFEGINNLSGYNQILGKVLLKNILGVSTSGYELSYKSGSGYKFGGVQSDLSGDASAQSLLLDILTNARDEENNLIFADGADFYNTHKTEIESTSDALSSGNKLLINQAISSDYGRNALHLSFADYVLDAIDHIDNVISSLPSGNIKTTLQNSNELRAYLVDYYSQFGFAVNDNMYNFLKEDAVTAEDGTGLQLSGMVTSDDIRNFVSHTNDSVANQTEFNERYDSTEETLLDEGVGRYLSGTNGTDNLTGSSNDDVILSNGGADIINGGAGNDVITLGSGIETVNADDGDDLINAHVWNTTFTRDSIDGGNGSDTISYALYDNSIKNSATAATEGLNINLVSGQSKASHNVFGATAVKDSFANIENVIGSAYRDTIIGNTAANHLQGGAGDDVITGGGGADIIDGGDGHDVLSAYDDSENAEFKDHEGVIFYGGAGDDIISAIPQIYRDNVIFGNNTIYGGDGNDTVTGSYGADTVYGGAGNDVIDLLNNKLGGAVIDGGDGDDYIKTNIAVANTITGGSGSDIISGGGNVSGGEGNDYLGFDYDLGGNLVNAASHLNSTYNGGLGNDFINGGNGNDTYIFHKGDGNDTITDSRKGITVSNGFDQIVLGAGITLADISFKVANTSNSAEYGNDLIINIAGGDSIRINAQNLVNNNVADNYYSYRIEQLKFADNSTFDLTNTAAMNLVNNGTNSADAIGITYHATIYGNGGNDSIFLGSGFAPTSSITAYGGSGDDDINFYNGTVHSVGHFIYGDAGNDTINGSSASDTIDGGADNDTIYGNGGNDTIYGGSGNDLIYGGEGTDIIYGGDGNDEIIASSGYNENDIVYGGKGNNIIWADYNSIKIVITPDEGTTDTIKRFYGTGFHSATQYNHIIDLSAFKHIKQFSDLVINYTDSSTFTIDLGTKTLSFEEAWFGPGVLDANDFIFYSNSAPTANNVNISVNEDNQYIISIEDFLAEAGASDIDLDTLTISSVQAANFGTVALNGGNITFTPYADYFGNASFTFTVSDGSKTVTKTANVTVNPVNDNPVAVGTIANQNLTAGNNFSLTVDNGVFSDIDGDILNYSATLDGGAALPAWLTFDSNTRTFSGTPNSAAIGSLIIALTAADAFGSATQLFTLNIGNHVVNGTSGNDVLNGTAENDIIHAGAGSDAIFGGAGDDILHYSNDEFITSTNGYAINYGSPDMILVGEPKVAVAPRYMNHDGFNGGDGYDIIQMGNDSEALFLDNNFRHNPFGANSARIVDVEEIRAGGGNDIVDLTSKTLSYGDITIRGGDGNDVIWASSGNDHLYGDEGNDNLFGGTGNDVLNGGAGADILRGGLGADSFVFDNISDSTLALHDVIVDFERGTDVIDLSGLADDGITGINDLIITNNGEYTHVKAADSGIDFHFAIAGVFNLDDSDFNW